MRREQPSRPRYLLAFNAGSSSLKVEVFTSQPWGSNLRAVVEDIGRARPTLRFGAPARAEPIDAATHGAAAELVLERLLGGRLGFDLGGRDVLATGHRMV